MLLPNKAFLLRRKTVVLTEFSDDWDAGRKYLTITR